MGVEGMNLESSHFMQLMTRSSNAAEPLSK